MQVAADALLLTIGDIDDLALQLAALRDIFEHHQAVRFTADLDRCDDAASGEETPDRDARSAGRARRTPPP